MTLTSTDCTNPYNCLLFSKAALRFAQCPLKNAALVRAVDPLRGPVAGRRDAGEMNRRDFLLKSTSILAGSLCGLNAFSKALAFGGKKNKASSKPLIALIIDDIGFSFYRTQMFLDLEVPITFSILPWLAHSRELACHIHENGHEIMLHQPMEPLSAGIDPGPGAL